jgi:FkbM family methyltransferase
MKKIIQLVLIKSYKYIFVGKIISSKYGRLLFEFLYFKYKIAFEASEIKTLKNYIPKGSVVIDVGANIGFFTIKFAEWVGSTGQVISIEPDKLNFDRLINNVEKNNFIDRVTFVNAAVSEKCGEVNFFINPFNPMDHRISENGFKIISVTIDYLCSRVNYKNVKLIKIDVQGAENLVIKGAFLTIERFSPLLYIEIEYNEIDFNRAKSLISDLQSFGYDIYSLNKDKLNLITNTDQVISIIKEKGYADFLFKKQNQ